MAALAGEMEVKQQCLSLRQYSVLEARADPSPLPAGHSESIIGNLLSFDQG